MKRFFFGILFLGQSLAVVGWTGEYESKYKGNTPVIRMSAEFLNEFFAAAGLQGNFSYRVDPYDPDRPWRYGFGNVFGTFSGGPAISGEKTFVMAWQGNGPWTWGPKEELEDLAPLLKIKILECRQIPEENKVYVRWEGEASIPTVFFIEKMLLIQASVEKIWNQLSTLIDLVWIEGVEKVELVEESSKQLGAERRVYLKNGAVLLERVIDWRVNDSLAFVIAEGLPFKRYYTEFELRTVSDTSTEVIWRAMGQPLLPKEQISGFKDQVSGLYERSLRRLADKLEDH